MSETGTFTLQRFAAALPIQLTVRFPAGTISMEKYQTGAYEIPSTANVFAGREGVLLLGDFVLGRVRLDESARRLLVLPPGLTIPHPDRDPVRVRVRVDLGSTRVETTDLPDKSWLVFDEEVDGLAYVYVEDCLVARAEVAAQDFYFGALLDDEITVFPMIHRPGDPLAERTLLQKRADAQRPDAHPTCRMVLGETRLDLREIARWENRTYIPLDHPVGAPLRLEFSDGRVREGEIGGKWGRFRNRCAQARSPAPFPHCEPYVSEAKQTTEALDDKTLQSFHALLEASADELFRLLKDENPQAIAFVLNEMDSDAANKLLALFPEGEDLRRRMGIARKPVQAVQKVIMDTLVKQRES